MGTVPDTDVVPAESHQKPLLSSMLERNLAELGSPRRYPYLESYWSDPARYPFFIVSAGRVAGFALVRRLKARNELEMAEFYVAPEFRRVGIGRTAAQVLFGRFPAKWSVSVLASNTIGGLFWSQVVPAKTPGQIKNRRTVFSFSTDGKQAA